MGKMAFRFVPERTIGRCEGKASSLRRFGIAKEEWEDRG
jgi:hypothetical protein